MAKNVRWRHASIWPLAAAGIIALNELVDRTERRPFLMLKGWLRASGKIKGSGSRSSTD